MGKGPGWHRRESRGTTGRPAASRGGLLSSWTAHTPTHLRTTEGAEGVREVARKGLKARNTVTKTRKSESLIVCACYVYVYVEKV